MPNGNVYDVLIAVPVPWCRYFDFASYWIC
jgi:hypothetical protein